jgi:hypothetical protein
MTATRRRRGASAGPMPFHYSAFGLNLASTDAIGGLVPHPASAVTHVRIWFDTPGARFETERVSIDPWYVSETDCRAVPALRVWKIADGRFYKWLYGDGTEFIVDGSGTQIWATWPASSTLEDTSTYLLGPILAFALRLRGITCLHGSAVSVDDRALIFVGPPRAGKSTLAAAFGQLGYPVLSDDVAAIAERDGNWLVLPAYPQLRLWPESVALLFGYEDALRPLTPNWNKRALELLEHGYRFEERPLPIAAVYVLGERTARTETHIQRMCGREMLRTLLANTYVGYVLDGSMRRQEFSMLGRLASNVPVRIIRPPEEPSRLCAAIIEDCEALGCTPSPTMAR